MQTDAAPEAATVQPASRGQGHAEQKQPHKQADHGPEAQVETGVHKAEEQGLAGQGPATADQQIQFTPEPTAEEQFLSQANTKTEQQGVGQFG